MKTITKALALLLAVACIFCFAACNGGEKSPITPHTTTDKKSTVDVSAVDFLNDGYLTIGTEASYLPFENQAEDGSFVGYDMDLVQAVADKMGVKVKIINTGFDGILNGIGVNYDCVVSAVTINDERKAIVEFSTPYMDNYQAVVVAADSSLTVSSLLDLDGKDIAYQKGTTSDAIITDLEATGSIDANAVANESVATCFTMLDNGEVNYALVDSTVADAYVAKNPDKYKIAFTDTTEPEQFGVAMGKDNEALKKAFDAAIAELKAEGFFEKATGYWFG